MRYVVYMGQREGTFSVNSRATPGKKYRIRQGEPVLLDDGDSWIMSMQDFLLLSLVDFTPVTKRIPLARPSYLPKYQAAWLEGLAATLPDPARVVELGTGTGTSLLRILYGLALHEDALVWTVDILECPDAKEHVASAQIPHWRYEMITGDSVKAAESHTESLDMVYVDGNHSYNVVKSDILAWEKHLKFGGLMVFDDYDDPTHEVTGAINDTVMNNGDLWNFVGVVGYLAVFEKLKPSHEIMKEFIEDNGIVSVGNEQDLFDESISRVAMDGLWLEFGVATGRTIKHIASKTSGLVYGFDSFRGLPEDFTPAIKEGHFKQDKIPEVPDNVELIIGLFQEKLELFLARRKEKIAYIHLDADLYSSTKYVLFTLAEHERFQVGTVIQLDDIFYYDHKWYTDEFDAFNEFVGEFGIEYEWIGYANQRASVKVTKVRKVEETK